MRTYVLEILNKYKRYSEAWDIKRILCDKSWIVFNDSCDREIYIFHENGSLIQSRNGIVYSGSWQYVTANKSIVILSQGQAYMLHPYIFDNVFFVLQQDGTERYAFLMDEAKLNDLRLRTLMDISSYFEETVRKEQANQELVRKQKLADYEQRLRSDAEIVWIREIDEILNDDQEYRKVQSIKIKLLIFSLLCSLFVSLLSYFLTGSSDMSIMAFFVFYCVIYVGLFIYMTKTNRLDFREKEKKEIFIRKYIDEHLLE